ncbi:MAG TPA: hypothetical protein VGJ83_03065 [Gemmatimonadales bacterium]|jgi:hypothetical protein
MKRPTDIATVLLLGATAVGCDSPGPVAPSVTSPLFAAATITAVTATGPLTTADSGTSWVSGGTLHVRNLVLEGPVSGDITGTITTVARVDVVQVTGTGAASGTFTISGAAGTWNGVFHGTFDAGVFSGGLVGRGTGAYEGQILRARLAQTGPATNVVRLTGTILNPGG